LKEGSSPLKAASSTRRRASVNRFTVPKALCDFLSSWGQFSVSHSYILICEGQMDRAKHFAEGSLNNCWYSPHRDSEIGRSEFAQCLQGQKCARLAENRSGVILSRETVPVIRASSIRNLNFSPGLNFIFWIEKIDLEHCLHIWCQVDSRACFKL
jgi:hypothetical protein